MVRTSHNNNMIIENCTIQPPVPNKDKMIYHMPPPPPPPSSSSPAVEYRHPQQSPHMERCSIRDNPYTSPGVMEGHAQVVLEDSYGIIIMVVVAIAVNKILVVVVVNNYSSSNSNVVDIMVVVVVSSILICQDIIIHHHDIKVETRNYYKSNMVLLLM